MFILVRTSFKAILPITLMFPICLKLIQMVNGHERNDKLNFFVTKSCQNSNKQHVFMLCNCDLYYTETCQLSSRDHLGVIYKRREPLKFHQLPTFVNVQRAHSRVAIIRHGLGPKYGVACITLITPTAEGCCWCVHTNI